MKKHKPQESAAVSHPSDLSRGRSYSARVRNVNGLFSYSRGTTLVISMSERACAEKSCIERNRKKNQWQFLRYSNLALIVFPARKR
jgi:hypothetical protein